MLYEITISFTVGLIIGAAYFIGLWFTVRRLTVSGLTPSWFIISAVVRLAALIGVLFWFMDGHAEKLLAAVAGVIAARFIATSLMGGGNATTVSLPGRSRATGTVDADHA